MSPEVSETPKVEVWKKKRDKGTGSYYVLRIQWKHPVYGIITFYSDRFDGIREADSRAFAIARDLGIDRDTLPVCGEEREKPDIIGKRHAETGIEFCSEGQNGWINCREYARGYLVGVPYGDDAAMTKKRCLLVAQSIAGWGGGVEND